MYRTFKSYRLGAGGVKLTVAGLLVLATSAVGIEIDRSRYISPDQLRPGMKGFGRTVVSGTKIETFDLEIVSVLHNAYYAKKDVIVVRCSGLNLEHSGIVGGMSGSPCYVRDEKGTERLFGAVAYGWTFNKDPICGVQPITEMIDVASVRDPTRRAEATRKQASAPSDDRPRDGSRAIPIGELIARAWPEPLDPASRFSALSRQTEQRPAAEQADEGADPTRFGPLAIPVTVSGASQEAMTFLRDRFRRFGLVPVASGGVSAADSAEARDVKLEPGSALCVALMMGDMQMDAFGTCTEVMGDRVLGFGHSLFGDGAVELPLATGFVHTVIPSVYRSNKVGSSLATVGTLWGDEASAVFGAVGESPKMVPLDVMVTDVRGERSYHYDLAHEEFMTAPLIGIGVMESVFANSNLPQEHTVRYAAEVSFEGLEAYRTRNFTSQSGAMAAMLDVMYPVAALMRAPFGKAKATRARVEITIEQGARTGQIDDLTMPRSIFKPGEQVTVRIRWFHYRQDPKYTHASYSLTLPKDTPDGEYELMVGSAAGYLRALESDKPHLFQAETLAEALEAMNRVAALPENRLYMHLKLPRGGLAIKKAEMPELPSFQRQILTQAKRTDVRTFSEALVAQHETEFAVSGQRTLSIRVSRRADQ